ncbi:MAG: hypothetical protein HGA57_01170 [Chlorobium limicola]|uniref:Uncharacterized protein n=1 Tax=Chlorobium limicola (strain DSM 245 / NBRC 103803 / 6330) TaxID=290315 RepID=B3ECB4_CHLL2|nr:hypothetical protein [Chlorobium limicola]ACD90189.1 hypothetical protein Clim_1120 [Chlorobium limicola DSM 245]NTV19986.1 hypothetical protein [Chlorobium limicola]
MLGFKRERKKKASVTFLQIFTEQVQAHTKTFHSNKMHANGYCRSPAMPADDFFRAAAYLQRLTFPFIMYLSILLFADRFRGSKERLGLGLEGYRSLSLLPGYKKRIQCELVKDDKSGSGAARNVYRHCGTADRRETSADMAGNACRDFCLLITGGIVAAEQCDHRATN